MTRRRRMQWIALTTCLVVIAGLGAAVVLSRRRPDLGLVEGRLRPCSDSPNCVCSTATDDRHAVPPLDAGEDPRETMNRLRASLQDQPRIQFITDEETYIHAEFKTPMLRFVDDVEFLLDETEGVIHVRSASRVGHSDLGANRRRVEMIRQTLAYNND